MPPTREEILKRIRYLPENLQQAALEALEALRREEESFTRSAPAGAQPERSFVTCWSGQVWPGYLWFLKQSSPRTLAQIVTHGKYWLLGHEERKYIRETLDITTQDIDMWRHRGKYPAKYDALPGFCAKAKRLINPRVSSSERTDPPAPGSRPTSSEGSPPP